MLGVERVSNEDIINGLSLKAGAVVTIIHQGDASICVYGGVGPSSILL